MVISLSRMDEKPLNHLVKLRRNGWFWAIIGFALVSRLIILVLSQRHVHSDEAIIGLMAKHISEGRYFPFYMYGQDYNAGAAWEAYIAAIPFKLFGVGVVPLKLAILMLFLGSLSVFYKFCEIAYNRWVAVVGSVVLIFTPSLLKWNFQVRGYTWYFLGILVAALLYRLIQRWPTGSARLYFLFGLVSGLCVWGLELSLPMIGAMWLALVISRRQSWQRLLIGIAGFFVGYGPAIIFNFTHQFANWHTIIAYKSNGNPASLLRLSTYIEIAVHEMPKFFGPDTVLLYYPEIPLAGLVFYFVALTVLGVTIWPFVTSPRKLLRGIQGKLTDVEQSDFLMIMLVAASFIPYLTAPLATPSYLLAACLFISILTGRVVQRWFFYPAVVHRSIAVILFTAVCVTGFAVMIQVARADQIETLTTCEQGSGFCMTRIPGSDMDAVETQLQQVAVTSVWTTVSFVYPLIFETGERFVASNAIFSRPRKIYPKKFAMKEASVDRNAAFVLERTSPFLADLESRFAAATGLNPERADHGKMTLIYIPKSTATNAVSEGR